MTYPSGRVVNLNYATGGGCCNSRLSSVVDQTTNTTIAGSLAYNAAGETTSMTLGNGVIETFGYNSRLQQTAITAALGPTTLMNFAYDYGTSTTNTGRVLSRADSIQPEHSTKYAYDSIYRLSQVVSNDAGSSWAIAWSFDTWGNRLTQTPQGLATSKVGTQTLGYTNNRLTTNTYDAAGNQTNDGLHNYTFNAENQITQMDAGAAVYAYDGENRRMKKTVGSETTYYFYGITGLLCEFTTTNTGATQASAGDRATYRTSDSNGTAVLLISASGTVVENNRTLPYGEAWLADTASTNDNKFNTYQRDAESGLDYAMNRYYANTTGRFSSVDKGRVALFVPQTMNRFVYTGNDPINYLDPNGNDITCLLGGGVLFTCVPLPVNPFSGFAFSLLARFLTGLGGDPGLGVGYEDWILVAPEGGGEQNAPYGIVTFKVNGAKELLKQLGNGSEACNALLANVGTNLASLVAHIGETKYDRDGRSERGVLYRDTLLRRSPYYNRRDTRTVADIFAFQGTGLHALADFNTNRVYINADVVAENIWTPERMAALLLHEALHTLLKREEGSSLGSLSGTGGIDAIQEKCTKQN